MTASEKSWLGLAKQTALGTPNVTDAEFDYLLFNKGSVSPANSFLPIDMEVGGGAMPRGVRKVGVTSGGQLQFIPRPHTLGHLFLGALGEVDSVGVGGPEYYDHTFTLPTDQFDAPYFTLRSAPGDLLGEQFQDVRVGALGLQWKGADFVRGTVALLGGLPTPVATTSWGAAALVDGGPPFLAPKGLIELPTGTDAKVLSGAFGALMNIPMDQQWIVGSYSPDAFDINSRVFQLSLAIKMTDDVLYEKMAYDPAQGGAWAAAVFKEADILLEFETEEEIDPGVNYKFSIAANGSSGDSANVEWSVTPIALQAGAQIVLNVTGTFIADAVSDPITVVLSNLTDAY